MTRRMFMGLAIDDGGEESPRIGELTRLDEGERFPFEAWARRASYPYRREWVPVLTRCGSAAEVFFLRPVLERDGAVVGAGSVSVGGVTVTLQHQVKQYAVDVLVTDGRTRLAIEIDGMAFHHRSHEQVAGDYLRQRRIVARGYTVIRFTAMEAFRDAAECWRQVEAILAVRRPA